MRPFILAVCHITAVLGAAQETDVRLGLLGHQLGLSVTGENGGQTVNINNGGNQFQNPNSGFSGGQSGNFQEGRDLNHCCWTSDNLCPVETGGGFSGGGGGGGFGGQGINPRDQGTTTRIASGKIDIDTRIVNSPTGVIRQNGCAPRKQRCCYRSKSFMNSIRGCVPTNRNFQDRCSKDFFGGGGGKACGTRNFFPRRGLRQGEASAGEFPWSCLVLKDDNHFVGACVIIPSSFDNDVSRNTRQVLTVAHRLLPDKIGPNERLKVRILEYDASDFNPQYETAKHEEFTVTRIQKHREFRAKRLSNNLAVLTLDRQIQLNKHDHVNAACLPTCLNKFDFQFANGTGPRCWVAGWGRDHQGGEFSAIQRKVDVPLVDRQTCQCSLREALRQKTGDNNFVLSDSEICAGGEEGKDACDGDGGAPLVCQATTGQWYVVGLVSWGVGCAQANVPGVYTKVDYFESWLRGVLSSRG